MYRDKFRFSSEGNPAVQLGAADLPRGARHKDEFFGETETYRRQVAHPHSRAGRGTLRSEGGIAGLRRHRRVLRADGIAGVTAPRWRHVGPRRTSGPRWSIFASDMDIAQLFQGNAALVLASFFGFGLLLSFTPCVLPMIPILAGIVAGEGARLEQVARVGAVRHLCARAWRSTYAAAGVAAAYVGSLLAAALQNVWVLGAFAAVFVLARAVDVRGLRAAASRAFCSSALRRRARKPAGRPLRLGRRHGRAFGGDRQSLRRRRRSPARCSTSRRLGRRGARRQRRCSPWRSAWACR